MSQIPIFSSVKTCCASGKVKLDIQGPSDIVDSKDRNNLAARGIINEYSAKYWMKNQLVKVKEAIIKKEDVMIDLASTEYPIRLDGGFLEYDEEGIFLIYRTNLYGDPIIADLCASIFETSFDSPFEMMMAESLGILRYHLDAVNLIVSEPFKDSIVKKFQKKILPYMPQLPPRIQLTTGTITPMKDQTICYNGNCHSMAFRCEPKYLSIELIGLLKTTHKEKTSYIDSKMSGSLNLNRPVIKIKYSGEVELWKNGDCQEIARSERIMINEKVQLAINEFIKIYPEHEANLTSCILA